MDSFTQYEELDGRKSPVFHSREPLNVPTVQAVHISPSVCNIIPIIIMKLKRQKQTIPAP